MKNLFAIFLLLCAATFASADSVQLVSAPHGETGPYDFSVNGSATTTPLICYSALNSISVGEQWNVQIYTISTIGNLTGDFAGSVQQYDEIGYLADQLFADPGNTAIQDAIWAVLGKGGAQNSYFFAAVDFVNANPNYRTADLFYIPVGDFSQNSLGVPQPLVGQVPEPASILLFGSGLIGFCGFLRKRVS